MVTRRFSLLGARRIFARLYQMRLPVREVELAELSDCVSLLPSCISSMLLLLLLLPPFSYCFAAGLEPFGSGHRLSHVTRPITLLAAISRITPIRLVGLMTA